jgi:DNA-binding transcriptional MerR regulator
MAKSIAQTTFDFTSVEGPVPVPVLPITTEEIISEETEELSIANEPIPKITKPAIVSSPGINKRGRKSLKDISLDADLIQVPEDEILFKKQYYSIGEVALMFRENQSLIRYWETEFDILEPRKNRKGDRFFRPVDIKNLVMIYDLLRRRKFTIDGAKDYLKKNNAQHPAGKAEDKFALIQSLRKIKGFLLEIKANL